MSRNRFTLLALLSGRAHDYAHLARPLLHSLERMHHFDIEVTEDFGALNTRRARVLLAASDVPLDGDQAARLNEFVRLGGGVVLLHGTLATWSEHDAIAEMAGWRLGQPTQLTELVIRVTDHPVTERLTPELRVEDELYVSEGPPAEANVLMSASWRFSDQVVAYERHHGDGRFVQIGLGHRAATYQQPDFQSRRWDPDYLAMREAVRSGRIGELFYMESFIGGYSHPCDFWHSHEPISGGTIYDWGSHYFDWILQLFPDVVKKLSAHAHKRVWHDVSNSDQVRVDLTFANGAQASFLQSDIAGAMKPKWYVLGTRGAVVGEWRDEPVPADFPARVKVLRPADGARPNEEIVGLPARDEHGFYRNLADHLAWDEPLAVTAAEARRTVAVMEAATRSIARGGAELEVDI